MTDYQSITIKTEDGRTIYFPRDYQFVRYAGTAACQVVSRIVELRVFLEQEKSNGGISEEIYRKFQKFVKPVVMEEKFLSSNLVTVHNAIVELIEQNPPIKEGDAM